MLMVALFKISVCFRTNFTGLCVTIKSVFFAPGDTCLTFEVEVFLLFTPPYYFSLEERQLGLLEPHSDDYIL